MVTVADGEGTFGRLLQRHRRAAGLSQQELAERAGLSLRGLADLERGIRRSPYPATVRRLVEALGLDEAARAALLAAAQPGTPASGPAVVEPTRSLPVPLSSFVGRERELAEVKGLLETTRLVTLTGTGGIGKTRLALQLALQLTDEFADGVALVELAALTDPELVAKAVATALGIPEQPRRPLLEVLADALRPRRLLLVLDNCEHLIVACARLADHLLRSCPNLSLLATSREVLGIAGEVDWRVPPLTAPEGHADVTRERVAGSEAVRLFVLRATSALPGFGLTAANAPAIAHLCQRLDGIPLALELAAARVKVLSVEQLSERLEDALRLLTAGSRTAPARQQTLRATLDWSYGLLTDQEQHLFDRLSVFAGGWTLEAAEAVCAGEDIEHAQVLDLLARLVDKSLVTRVLDNPARCRLLEPLRQYAGERLVARGEADTLGGRQVAFFLASTERIAPGLLGPAGRAALDQLDQEHDNLRAALRWLVARGEVEHAQQLAGALGRFWFLHSHFAEGEAWLNQVLALPGGERHTSSRAACVYGLGTLVLARGDYVLAEAHLGAALALFRELGNRAAEAWALMGLGQAVRLRGDHRAAQPLLEEGVAVSEVAGQTVPEAMCLVMLADMSYDQGEMAGARAQAEAALAGSTRAGWLTGVANARRVLGQVEFAAGDYVAARARLEESLAAARELGSPWLSAQALVRLGPVAIKLGDIEGAHAQLSQSLELAREQADTAGIARGLEGFAQLGAAVGQDRLALQLAGAAAALREQRQAPLSPTDRRLLDQALARTRTRLGGAGVAERARKDGATLGPEQALDSALRLDVSMALGVAAEPLRRQVGSPLTRREQEVAIRVARGLTNRQVAAELVISATTAERHVLHILNKLGYHSRAQIAAWAAEHGLLSQGPG